ncbi:MAG: iron-containing alcohol dehydrogenase [Treponema sp.]|nr:iron-containing alcohol dehydrogenase [Treponema sp.]
MGDIYFNIDPEIIIGTDTINRAGTICGKYGNKVLIAADKTLHQNRETERLIAILKDSNVEAILFDEIPSVAMADIAASAATLAHAARCSSIIGFGGIATQAIARIAALIVHAEIDIFDLLDGKFTQNGFLSYIAIPSIKEDFFLFSSTCLAVDPRDRSIKQIRLPKGLCKTVIMDNDFISNENTAYAFDGFCMSVEAYCSKKANFLSDPLLEQAIAFYSTVIAGRNGKNGIAGEAGFLASLGVALSSPGMGSVLSYLMARRFPVAKSLCAAALLPSILEKLTATRPEKIASVASLLGKPSEKLSVTESASLVTSFIRSALDTQNINPHLQSLGLQLDPLIPLAEAARDLDFAGFSPWTVTSEELIGLVKQSF